MAFLCPFFTVALGTVLTVLLYCTITELFIFVVYILYPFNKTVNYAENQRNF